MARAASIAGGLLAGAALMAAAPDEPGSRRTRDFVQAAAGSDAFEMAEAESVLAQSRDPRVLAFARMMMRDHAETSRRLSEAAARAGLKPPPMAVGSDQAPFLAALQSLRGPEFDQAYARQQALAHRSALVTAQGYAADGDEPAVRAAAKAAVPVISAHLAAAEQLQAGLGGS